MTQPTRTEDHATPAPHTSGAAPPVAPPPPPIATYKSRLKSGCNDLYHQFDLGIPIAALVRERSDLIDAVLCELWEHHLGPNPEEAALIAVGGYGRQELQPASDIDILILMAPDAELTRPLEQLVTCFWDIGLEIGHSVRTVADCVSEASNDVTVMTNLLEARLLSGSETLFQEMRAATAPEHIWDSERFFAAKAAEQRARWHKYGETAYNLEPNIKENPGGLRDIQMIGWVAKRHFDAETLHDLVGHGFLTEHEHQALVGGQTLLWRIRFSLHRLTGRREDRLLFDYQRTLAKQFGFCDGANNLAVEQFMQQYYRTVQELNRLNEMLLQLFREAILLHDDVGPPVPINKRFQSRSGYLEVTSPSVFRRYPIALLEVFHILQTRPELEGVRASTIRLIRENRHRIDDDFRADLRARSLFMEIFRESNGLTHAIRRMNRYGVLAAYIPAFANIVGRMQYDLLHVYTVDEHTLTLVRNLRRFTIPKHDDEFPLCSAVGRRIPKLELLYLGGLFHDIAKGRGGDHSTLGARDAWDFCRLHGLSEFDSRLVAWLVEHHLVMSMTAQRKDISDPEVVQSFAELIGDPNRLDYLYLLTVADARATNPERWNSWIDALLRELYYATRRALLRGLDNPQAQDELISQKQAESMRLVARYGGDPSACNALWLKFSLDFFLHNSPDEIAWQTRQILSADPTHQPLVVIRPVTARGGTEIFIYTRDRANLFARTTATLDQMGLDVMDARVMTTDDGMAVNSYQVLDQDGEPVENELHMEEIRSNLTASIMEQGESPIRVARTVPRRLRHFPIETRINFSADEPNHRTIMRLTTLDRPGLLAEVGAVFQQCGIRLQNAKIATVGAEVDDVFFITTEDDTPITCETALACLRREIHDRLEGQTKQS
ncbi:[protein-PII] uridylyltransferase [Imhoffiella purpurea]|uniref:Bifunctional uridylyltransferase/uridylyl-removing enzyme n=1 Tax=Imhoffiella purpurea TaxID=1249627 RepID=W9VG46_9GAMM|nr:[protein-PII] uridylyltransferase [Imhoffiella purpurea]EXJ15012.1 [Protein-PII] uridylyltransferase [Imhoffiella purpurea]